MSDETKQLTLVFVKPDGVQRRIVGDVIGRFERKGLQLAGLKLMRVTEAQARTLYAEHEGKHFYEPLVRFALSGPIVGIVLRGKDAPAIARKLMGATFGPDADPGTIRGDHGVSNRFNLIHGSDSPESAAREIPIFFDESEIIDWDSTDGPWLYDFSTGEPV